MYLSSHNNNKTNLSTECISIFQNLKTIMKCTSVYSHPQTILNNKTIQEKKAPELISLIDSDSDSDGYDYDPPRNEAVGRLEDVSPSASEEMRRDPRRRQSIRTQLIPYSHQFPRQHPNIPDCSPHEDCSNRQFSRKHPSIASNQLPRINWNSLVNILKNVKRKKEEQTNLVVQKSSFNNENNLFDLLSEDETVQLIKNFKRLEEGEKKRFLVYMKSLEIVNPQKVKRLKTKIHAK